MNIDSLNQYIRACGGQDYLVFDDANKAAIARTAIIDQLDDDSISVENHPKVEQFDNLLRLRLKDMNYGTEPVEQAAEVF